MFDIHNQLQYLPFQKPNQTCLLKPHFNNTRAWMPFIVVEICYPLQDMWQIKLKENKTTCTENDIHS